MRINIQYTLLMALLLIVCTGVKAQTVDTDTVRVKPLKEATLRPLLVDVWLYGAGSYKSHSNLWTANNYSSESNHLYDTFTDIGVEADFHRGGLLRFGGSMGYKFERYAYDPGLFSSEGVFSHWLSTSLNVNYWFFGGGLLADIYLGSRIKNSDNFSYEGLYGDCFNRFSYGCYGSYFVMFMRIKVEGRMGYYFKTQFNQDKIAHYNLHKSYVNGLFWEVKLSYRLFTSGRHYNISYMF